jgi:uncharacterized protein
VREIDLSSRGKRLGFMWVWAGSNESAYQNIPVPVAVIVNEPNPTTVLLAGVHGDEHEGQVVLNRLAAELEPGEVRGRVIILPAANPLACAAGRRFSEPGEGNLFRAFGSGVDTPTSRIAAHLERQIFGQTDLIIDLHSGGRSLRYVPSALVFGEADAPQTQHALRLAERLGLPFCLHRGPGSPAHLFEAAARHGAAYLGAELGGAGALDQDVVMQLFVALRNLLEEGPLATRVGAGTSMKILRPNSVLLAENNGIFERDFALGDEVHEGDVAGRMHRPLDRPGACDVVHFAMGGKVMALRPLASCARGDCLAELAD